ncbi:MULTISPECIES: hypothetical protein [unclassified Pseudomonas]|uniref:hypothetical protein n=2 Tax=Pseudomonas TaxID=286 RepID=UPI002691797B
MKRTSSIRPSLSITRHALVPLFAALLVTGCAHDPDIRMGHDNVAGTTLKSPPDFIKCVRDELPAGEKAFMREDNHALALFLESTDPRQSTGLVEIRPSGTQHHYSAYQRDAWYDKGRLLDAALMCS